MAQAPNGVDPRDVNPQDVNPQDVNPQDVNPQDWVTIWQSEWAAMAVDRELREGLIASTQAWNAVLAAGADRSFGHPSADAAAGAAPAGDASGSGEPGPTRP